MALSRRPLQRGGLLVFTWAALQGLPSVAGPEPIDQGQETPQVAPTDHPGQASRHKSSIPERPGFLVVRSDRQRYDGQTGRLTVSGNVEARFQGWRLLADRIELSESRRSVLASGRVRLFRGDQYLQASTLRYSEWEGSGELSDVYGVVDQESLALEMNRLQGTLNRSENEEVQGPAAGSEQPASPLVDDSFACPELTSDPSSRPLRQLLPPRRTALPTMPAPMGCPGGGDAQRSLPLNQILDSVALSPPNDPDPGLPTAGSSTSEGGDLEDSFPWDDRAGAIRQRVNDVRYSQSVETTVRLNLVPLIESEVNSPSGRSYRPLRGEQGNLTRLRFQASSIRIRADGWFAEEIAFTNDPFTPAKAWTFAKGVEATVNPGGTTSIRARRSRILLGDRISLPNIRDVQIGQQQLATSVDLDRRDRDGLYLGYNLPPLPIGREGSLQLQPQLLIQRIVEGRTDSYTKPGRSLVGPTVGQDAKVSDMFGLAALLDVPLGRFRLYGDANLSTFNPDNFRAGTRSNALLAADLGLPGHSRSQGGVFGSYRERVYNGSLGLQTVVYSYGAELEGLMTLNPEPAPNSPRRGLPYFAPIEVNWRAQSGNYQAALFDTDRLDTQWRSAVRGGLNSSLKLWESSLGGDPDPHLQLRYSPIPVIPGLGLDFGINGTTAFYQDGAQQSSLTLAAGPSFTLGRFERPYLDFTRFSASFAETLLDGKSPFGFDRTVDLRTVSFNAAQQIYGPLVLEAGATFNIDSSSRFYGDVSFSYVELKLKQRAYELGVYYSPYDGIGGIRIRLNDFDFTGGGSPFVPRPVHRGGEVGSQPAVTP